jgi:hypothetical protein
LANQFALRAAGRKEIIATTGERSAGIVIFYIFVEINA